MWDFFCEPWGSQLKRIATSASRTLPYGVRSAHEGITSRRSGLSCRPFGKTAGLLQLLVRTNLLERGHKLVVSLTPSASSGQEPDDEAHDEAETKLHTQILAHRVRNVLAVSSEPWITNAPRTRIA